MTDQQRYEDNIIFNINYYARDILSIKQLKRLKKYIDELIDERENCPGDSPLLEISVKEQRYMSLYSFVYENVLEDEANFVLGSRWSVDGIQEPKGMAGDDIRDDIELITKLCNHISPGRYVVSRIIGLKSDNDIEVREIDRYEEIRKCL